MMGWLRALTRLLAVIAFALSMYVWLLVSSLALATFNRIRGRGFWATTDVWRSDIFHRWSRLVLPLLGVRLEVHGTPPEPPFILVSNHLSYLDILLLAGRLRAVFVAKSEVRKWPLLGVMCRWVDTLFIEREKKSDVLRVMDRISHVLNTGRGVVFFPEGTTSDGRSVQPLKPALLEVPVRTARAVSWATISYSTPPASASAAESVCWWGGRNFVSHLLKLLRLKYINARLKFGDDQIRESNRKLLAARLHDVISRNFVSVT